MGSQTVATNFCRPSNDVGRLSFVTSPVGKSVVVVVVLVAAVAAAAAVVGCWLLLVVVVGCL